MSNLAAIASVMVGGSGAAWLWALPDMRRRRTKTEPVGDYGAHENWTPSQDYIEPELPDVELVKRSEDELIVHNLLNDIEANFRQQLDAWEAKWTQLLGVGPEARYQSLTALEHTQEIPISAITRRLRTPLPARERFEQLALPAGSAAA